VGEAFGARRSPFLRSPFGVWRLVGAVRTVPRFSSLRPLPVKGLGESREQHDVPLGTPTRPYADTPRLSAEGLGQKIIAVCLDLNTQFPYARCGALLGDI
jgi:hypothetical protein